MDETREPVVAQLRALIEPLLFAAQHGQVSLPMEWGSIPGRYLFTEAGLQQYADLERAYNLFRIELASGMTPERLQTIQRIRLY